MLHAGKTGIVGGWGHIGLTGRQPAIRNAQSKIPCVVIFLVYIGISALGDNQCSWEPRVVSANYAEAENENSPVGNAVGWMWCSG